MMVNHVKGNTASQLGGPQDILTAVRTLNPRPQHVVLTVSVKLQKRESVTLLSNAFQAMQTTERRVEWLTLLLRVREILGSNLGPQTSNPD
jgi:hypothetical protein